MDLGELKEAAAVLEEAAFLYPEEAGLNDLHVLSASEGWWAGDAAEVDAASREINNQEIVLGAMMADVGLLYEEGKYEQSLSVLDEGLDFSDDKTPFLASKANILSEVGDYPAALACYDTLISTLQEADQKDQLGKEAIIGALSGKITVIIHLERFDEALVIIDSVLADNPTSTTMIIDKGICYEKMGDYQEALSWFEYACFVDPQSIDGWIARGRILELLHENASALESYVTAIRLDSTNLSSRTQLIALLFKLKRHDDLLIHSERALHIYPYDPSILNYRGKTLEILGEWEDAATCFHRALEVCSDDSELSFALGRTLSKLHRDQEAFDHLMTAMDELESSPDIFAYLGHTLIELGKCGAAVDIFNRGLKENPEEANLIAARDSALEKLVVYSKSLF
jgi:tetratricopeptide (TPR) repeat protein